MARVPRDLLVKCSFPKISQDHMETLINLGNNYHLDEQEFGDHLEALQVNHGSNEFVESLIGKFKIQLGVRKGKNKENRQASIVPASPDLPARLSISLFSQRGEVGKVLAEFVGTAFAPVPGCRTEIELISRVPQGYFRNQGKGMLNARLSDFKDLFAEMYQKEVEPRLTRMSETELTVVGRIVSEDGGKLSAANLALQDKSDQVELDVSAIPDFLLYPGKIVAAVGNCSSLRFRVNQFLPSHASPMYPKQDPGLPLNMVVACGPFSCAENLDYEPLLALLDTIGSERCSLVLCGPFLDCENQGFKEELCPTSKMIGSDNTYQESLDRILQMVLSRIPTCDIVVVPSTQDLAQLTPLPQQPYQYPSTENFRMVPNPCCFTANGYLVGISTADVLREISTGSFSRTSRPVNRIKQAFGELLEQRCFQPFCPSDTPVDLQHLEILHLPSTPDILVTPSKMARMVEFVGETLCANPGPLVKGNEAGAYLRVTIAPGTGSVKERAQMQLIQV